MDYPNVPSRRIAIWLSQEYPKVFPDVESARSAIRRYRGNSGQAERNKPLVGKKHFRQNGTQKDGIIPLPEPISSDADTWKVYVIPEYTNALILNDVHIPFHDPVAVSVALEHGDKIKPDVIILNGDIIDFYLLSKYETNPTLRMSLLDEIDRLKVFLEHMRDRFPDSAIYYKEGNHEERLTRFGWRICPQMTSLVSPGGNPLFSLGELIDADYYNVKVIENKQPIRLGQHLHIFHGHEFYPQLTNQVSVSRALYLRAGVNALCGHLHRSDSNTKSTVDKTISTFSVGCLCKVHPEYRPLNEWSQGFATVANNNGAWSVWNPKIINGKIV